jgi:WD40 repeat protein
LDELALLPGTQLSIDSELVPPLYVLHDSAKGNDWPTMALFVHGLLDIERARRDTQAPDRQGDTALHIACEHGSSDVVETLLSDSNPSAAHAIGKSNHIADAPIMAACRAGHADIVTRLLHSAPTTFSGLKLLRKVRYDGHTFLTAVIASQNSSLLQLALDQSPFALIDSNQLRGATTYQGKLRALANAATCLEKWLRGADKLADKSATQSQLAKHSVLRTLASIIEAPTAPTPLRTALTNILAIMAHHWSILANPHQRSPLQRHRFGAQYALPWPPSILLAQMGAQGKGQSVSLPSPNLTRDSYLPTRTISPRRESRPHNPTRDILLSKDNTLSMALSHDSHTLVRQETDLLMTVDTATGLTTALRTTKQHGGISALKFIGLQCEDQPTATGHLSVILVDEKGTIFRWIPVLHTLLADHQHTDLPDTEARQAGAVSFTSNASALAFVSQEDTLHISHFRSAGEDCDLTAVITVRHNFSRRPVSNQGTHTMTLSNSLLTLSTTSGTTLWDGVSRDSHAKDGVADFICRLVLDGQFNEKDKTKPRREPCSLAFSGNGEYLATGCRGDMPGYDGTGSIIEIWNVVLGTLAFQLRTTHQKGVHALVFSTDTLLVSAGGEDHVTQVCHLDIHSAKLQVQQGDTHTAMRSTPLLSRQAKITDLVASERLIMASSADCTTLIWNVPHGST